PGPLPVVRGAVRMREGGAVVGAEVQCLAGIGSVDRVLAVTVSDATGAFEFLDLPADVLTPGERPAASLSIAVTADGRMPTRMKVRFLWNGEPVHEYVDIELDTGAEVRGLCVDWKGKHVAGAEVYNLVTETNEPRDPHAEFFGFSKPWEHARGVSDH